MWAVISIHALLAESDQIPHIRKCKQIYFYPRSPCGERPNPAGLLWCSSIFLSTLSLRRATRVGAFVSISAIISIHALLAESDPPSTSSISTSFDFYPRSPCGERRDNLRTRAAGVAISIHALLAESDALIQNLPTIIVISIHALLAESDFKVLGAVSTAENFYPRSPCGERLLTVTISRAPRLFLSTLSLRRATAVNDDVIKPRDDFYPRSPCGERPAARSARRSRKHFYPRSPCGERPLSRDIRDRSRYFYPRSPCGERPFTITNSTERYPFLSTLSLRRATVCVAVTLRVVIISIHALLAESDLKR